MGNHGALVVGRTLPQAFERLYFLERAAQAQLLAMSTGRPLRLIPDAVVARACAQMEGGGAVGGFATRGSALRCAEAHARSRAYGLRELSSPALKALDPLRAARSPLVFMLATMVFINYVDRGAMPTAAPLLRLDLHFSDTQMGILLSAFFWTYAVHANSHRPAGGALRRASRAGGRDLACGPRPPCWWASRTPSRCSCC